MAELADALASGASDRKVIQVQVLLSAPDREFRLPIFFILIPQSFGNHAYKHHGNCIRKHKKSFHYAFPGEFLGDTMKTLNSLQYS